MGTSIGVAPFQFKFAIHNISECRWSDGDEDGLERPESIIAGHMVSANDSIKHVTSVLQLAKHRLILWQLNELIASVEQFERDTIS